MTVVRDSGWNQDESQDEDSREQQKNQDPYIGVRNLAPQCEGQKKEPKNRRAGYDDDADKADPVIGEIDQWREAIP